MAKFPVKHIAGSEQLIDCLVPVKLDFTADDFANKKYTGYSVGAGNYVAADSGCFYYETFDTTPVSSKTYYTKSGITYTRVPGSSISTFGSTTYYEKLTINGTAAVYMQIQARDCEGIVGVYYKDGSSYRLKSDCADVLFIPGTYNSSTPTGVIRICAVPFEGRVIYLRRMLNRDAHHDSEVDPSFLPTESL